MLHKLYLLLLGVEALTRSVFELTIHRPGDCRLDSGRQRLHRYPCACRNRCREIQAVARARYDTAPNAFEIIWFISLVDRHRI